MYRRRYDWPSILDHTFGSLGCGFASILITLFVFMIIGLIIMGFKALF